MRRAAHPVLVLAAAAVAAAAAPVAGERLDATVRDSADGTPVADAVVYALPLGADAGARPVPEVEIDQVDKEFVPYVTAVTVGTRIAFPNSDDIRHHVYSFSEAKTFEIPLYEGMPPERVEFDTPGEVALGCNIHDWMRAYVFVARTPHFAVTGANGAAALELPAGEYRVEVWHPALAGEPEATGRRVDLAGADASLELSIERRRLWKPRRAPSARDPGYR